MMGSDGTGVDWEQLLEGGQGKREQGEGPAIKRLSYSHEAMIDAMVGNPAISGGQLARMFGVTEPWLSRVRSSDAFRERLRARTEEMVDPVLRAQVEEKFEMLVNRSLEVLMDKLSEPSEKVDPDLAMQAAALGAKTMGLGGFGARAAVHVSLPDPHRFEKIADRLRNMNQPQGVIDVQAVEVPR